MSDESVYVAACRRDEEEFLDGFWRASSGETGNEKIDIRERILVPVLVTVLASGVRNTSWNGVL
jgi:hypothetical protein